MTAAPCTWAWPAVFRSWPCLGRQILEPGPSRPSGRTVYLEGEDMNCSPCYSHGRFPTCAHQACMTAIGVDEVFKALMGVAADGKRT